MFSNESAMPRLPSHHGVAAGQHAAVHYVRRQKRLAADGRKQFALRKLLRLFGQIHVNVQAVVAVCAAEDKLSLEVGGGMALRTWV